MSGCENLRKKTFEKRFSKCHNGILEKLFFPTKTKLHRLKSHFILSQLIFSFENHSNPFSNESDAIHLPFISND